MKYKQGEELVRKFGDWDEKRSSVKDIKLQSWQKENLGARFGDKSGRDFTLRHMLKGWERTHMQGDIIYYITVFGSVWGPVAVERVIEGGFK